MKTVSERLEETTGTSFADAICYSGYRRGQSPRTGTYPTLEQVKEDLRILHACWKVIRIYDCSRHAELTLETIRNHYPDMRVLLGVDLKAEVNNPNCPWGRPLAEEELNRNRASNEGQVRRALELAQDYDDIVLAVSGGNEATVDWTDGLVPVERVAGYLQLLREGQPRPVTLCENNVPWQAKIADLVPLLDFIGIHSYPAWLGVPVDEALDWTQREYREIADLYPEKPVIITEAGWATGANGRGELRPETAHEANQAAYGRALAEWSREEGVPVFLFEAFDEPWKGSDDPDEPEKHWGLYHEDRTPKAVMQYFDGG